MEHQHPQPPLACHITMRLLRDQALTDNPSACRRLCASFWRREASSTILALRVVDTHIHLVTCADRPVAGRLAHDSETSMRWQLRLPPAFAAARFVDVDDIWHIRRAFDYVIGNAERHGVLSDPLFEGSNLMDLLGLRVMGRASASSVRRLLPRLTRDRLVELFRAGPQDLPLRAFDPKTPDAEAGLPHLVEAAASAACLPRLELASAEAHAARRAAAHVVSEWRTPTESAQLLQVHRSTLYRHLESPPDPLLASAIRAQLQLRAFLPAVR